LSRRDYIGNGVAAHRGNMSFMAENTMEAFISAANLGCDWLELDIQKTLDGQLVVTHDAYTLRTSGVNMPVAYSTLEQLRSLNFGAYLQDGRFYRLPLLSEVFELIEQRNIRVTIQPKCNGVVASAVSLARDLRVADQIAFNELNCEYLIEVKQLDSSIPVFWDRLPETNVNNDIHIAHTFGFECLMYVLDGLSRETVETVRAAGLECGVCVVNESADMDRFLDWGVRMFYTDYPELLLSKKK
jgi:glycerophosphoryl diester phosphodiesterase